jgi:hypothetical protein
MNIGIFSKRDSDQFFAGKLKHFLEEEGNEVDIFTEKNLSVNENLLQKDAYILKTRRLFFIYAAYFLTEHNIPVFPDPDISYKTKNRTEANSLLKKIGLPIPDYYMGSLAALRRKLDSKSFPLILKPIMGSGSRGVKLIKSVNELQTPNDQALYLEKYIYGTHYNVYFIEEEICPLEKPPLSNEHVRMDKVALTKDIKDIIVRFKTHCKTKFGHLDMVREESSNKLYVVDAGLFPQFSNWKCKGDPVKEIGNILLKQISNA